MSSFISAPAPINQMALLKFEDFTSNGYPVDLQGGARVPYSHLEYSTIPGLDINGAGQILLPAGLYEAAGWVSVYYQQSAQIWTKGLGGVKFISHTASNQFTSQQMPFISIGESNGTIRFEVNVDCTNPGAGSHMGTPGIGSKTIYSQVCIKRLQ